MDERKKRGRKSDDPSAQPYPTEDERLLETVEDREAVGEAIGKDAWRVFRIMGEFVEGFEDLAQIGRAVSIFGSARVRPGAWEYEACVETARRLGEAGYAVITGGGPGIMEAANKGARLAGTVSVGCNIELPFEQRSNEYLDVSIDFRYFFVRKTMFMKYAEAFVIFPGGFGTMDELFEALTLIQTQKVRDFPVVLFGSEYWSGLTTWLEETMAVRGKISPGDVKLMHVTDDPEDAVAHILRRRKERRARSR